MRLFWLLGVLLAACSTDTFVGPDGAVADSGGKGEGGTVGEAGGGDACAAFACSAPICATFDQGSESPFTDGSFNGQTEITTDEFVSCPASLLAQLDATGAGLGRAIAVSAPMTVSSLHLDAYVWLPANPNGIFSALTVREGGDTVQIAHDSSGQWTLHVSASSRDAPITPNLNQWNHVVLDVLFSDQSNSGQASLAYDGGNTAVVTDKTASNSTLNGVVVELGLSGSQTSAKMTAYYDNVSVGPGK